MSSPSMEDPYYQIDVGEKVWSEEAMSLKPLVDPLEPYFIGDLKGEDVGLLIDWEGHICQTHKFNPDVQWQA